ncbi:MAG: DUF5615 family PIN-like protein [Cyclobacteriaceae bacterium]
MIVADENIDEILVDRLRKSGHSVISIKQDYIGFSDIEVVELIRKLKAVLITEDKDFGELVFAHDIRDISVILLRFDDKDSDAVEHNLNQVLQRHLPEKGHCFITVTPNRIRVSKI